MKALADLLRWALILSIWGSVTYILWAFGWVWAARWVIPGFIIVLNIVGFATLPLYYLVGLSNPEVREAKQLLDDWERRERDST